MPLRVRSKSYPSTKNHKIPGFVAQIPSSVALLGSLVHPAPGVGVLHRPRACGLGGPT